MRRVALHSLKLEGDECGVAFSEVRVIALL